MTTTITAALSRDRQRPVPWNRPVIACSIPGCTAIVLPDGADATTWTFKRLRTAARRKKWTKDPLGLDCCPDHPKGHVPEPAEPVDPAEPISEVLDGEVVTETTELPPPGPITDPNPTLVHLPTLAAQARTRDEEVWATYAPNLDATQELTLGRFLAAHDELAAAERPDPLDDDEDGETETAVLPTVDEGRRSP